MRTTLFVCAAAFSLVVLNASAQAPVQPAAPQQPVTPAASPPPGAPPEIGGPLFPATDAGLDKVAADGISTVTVPAVPCGKAAHSTDGTTTCIGIPGPIKRKQPTDETTTGRAR